MASSKGIRAGRAYVELGTDDKITKGLRAAEMRLKAFGAGLRSIGTQLAALGAGAITPLLGAVKVFAGAGDTLDKMAARTGVSAEALSELGFAAEQSGADLETFETSLRRMQRSLVDAARGSQTAQTALGTLGLSIADLAALQPEQQFKLIADRLSRIADPTLQAALAMELFGKSGTRMLPMLKDGAAGIEALQQQARDFGLTISTQSAKDAAVFNDTLNILWRTLKQAAFTIGSALAPMLTDLAGRAARVVVAVTDWLRRNKALVVTVFKVAAAVTAAGVGLIAAGAAISGVGAALGGLAVIVKGVVVAFGAVKIALAAIFSPIGLIVAAVAGLGAVILTYTGAGAKALAWLGDTFGWLKDTAMKVVGGIRDALAAGDLALAAKVLWAGLKLIWEAGAYALRRPWIELTSGFMRAGINAFAGVKKAWISVSTWFWQKFPETTAFIAKTWASMYASMSGASARFQTWMTKRWIDLMGLFGNLTAEQIAEAKRMAEGDLVLELGKIEKQRQADLAEADRKKGLTDAEHEAEKARDLAKAEADRLRALDELDQERRDRLAAAEKALEDAQRELEQVRDAARKARERAEPAPLPGRRTDLLAGIEDQLPGLADLLNRKISATGTFNPLAVLGLGSTNPIERTAKATEETARHTKRLAENVGRLVFG